MCIPAHNVKRVELIVISVIEPGAAKVVEQEVCPTREREGIDHELFDWFDAFRAWLVVEDMHLAVADLHNVDVSGIDVTLTQGQGHIEAELGTVMSDIMVREDDGHLNCNRGRIIHEHEVL